MAKVRIAGTIVSNDEKWIYDWFDIDAFCINDLLKAITDEYELLEIEINSPGGSLFAGSEIYTKIKNHKGKKTVMITGLAASSASVIAMAGDVVKMSPTAQMMIHNVSSYGSGDYRDMEHLSTVLKQANEVVANAYMLKTGKTKEELLSMMNNEKWFTPQEAKEQGFIDEILFTENNTSNNMQLVAGFKPNIIPAQIINKMKIEKEQEQLNLLKLKEIM
jgi:phage prohead protease, HK97 family|nr:MAG TPA: Putative ATP dependent Clp protease [Caudoviricetes sp.]